MPGSSRDARIRRIGWAGLPAGLLERIEEYLLACLERETSPRARELARRLGYSYRRFEGTFHRATGVTPSGYLKARQISAAKLLLKKTDLQIDRVGYVAGFGTRRTFFRAFRKVAGTTPSAYRRTESNVSRPRTPNGGELSKPGKAPKR